MEGTYVDNIIKEPWKEGSGAGFKHIKPLFEGVTS